MTRKITIDPLTRVEGHGKITIHLNENNEIEQTRLHIVEFRGFEKFVQGRPFWEAAVLVQRLCGICPVSHHLAAAKAMDMIVGAGDGDALPPTAEKMRRLMHYGQVFQSHVTHFFHLAAPDLLFGIESDPKKRNFFNLILEHKELATRAILMRQFGQEIIESTAGKKIHGTGAIPGGINKHLTLQEKNHFLTGSKNNIDQMIIWAQEALQFFLNYHEKNKDFIDNYSRFPSNYLSMVRHDGALDLYHGGLRAIKPNGETIFDQIPYQSYYDYIGEDVKSWTYMKFPYIKSMGPATGWYTVGPLARMNTAKFIDTPLAGEAHHQFQNYTGGKPNHSGLHTHWARLIEVLHCGEKIKQLLLDPHLTTGHLTIKGERRDEGIGVIEAPRGTLFHHYKVDPDDLITMCNLIVSTTNNNQPMNIAVHQVATKWMTGKPEITEGMKNAVETVIRAYDPCLSCATHAFGQMNVDIKTYNHKGELY